MESIVSRQLGERVCRWSSTSYSNQKPWTWLKTFRISVAPLASHFPRYFQHYDQRKWKMFEHIQFKSTNVTVVVGSPLGVHVQRFSRCSLSDFTNLLKYCLFLLEGYTFCCSTAIPWTVRVFTAPKWHSARVAMKWAQRVMWRLIVFLVRQKSSRWPSLLMAQWWWRKKPFPSPVAKWRCLTRTSSRLKM